MSERTLEARLNLRKRCRIHGLKRLRKVCEEKRKAKKGGKLGEERMKNDRSVEGNVIQKPVYS